MKPRLSRIVAAGSLSLLAGCTVPLDPAAATGGFAGVGGMALGGQSTGGVSGAAAIGGGGLGGQSTGGVSGAGLVGGAGVGGQGAAGFGGGFGGGGVGGGGAGGTGSGGSGIPATYQTLKDVLVGLNPPCVASDCHGGTHMELPLLLVNDQLYTELTTYISVTCGNIPIVTPGDPERSALVKLIKGPCGVEPNQIPRMPNGCEPGEFGNCVPDNYIAAIEQWVRNGAPQ